MALGVPIKLPVDTLIVGGEEAFVRRTLIPKLATYGLKVSAVWSWDYVSTIPMKVDVIFFLTDMLGHSTYNTLLTEARKYGIKVINGTRKWSLNVPRLEKAGFRYNPAFKPPTEAEIDEIQIGNAASVHEDLFNSIENLVKGDSKKMKRNLKYLEPVEPESEASTVELEPEPVQPEPEAPIVEPEPKPEPDPSILYAADYEKMLKLVVSEPYLANNELIQRLGLPPKFVLRYVAGIRTSAGIHATGSPRIRLDRSVYVPTCQRLGVTPVEGEFVIRGAAPVVAAPVVAAPVVAAPVVAPKDDLQEIKDIVSMLRDEMAKRGVRQMVITPDGVEFERVIVVKGTF